jgi:hypothetical protein
MRIRNPVGNTVGLAKAADLDPHYFGKLNPDPHKNEKLDLESK